MDIDQLKHKLRELKKVEARIRFAYGGEPLANPSMSLR